MARIIFLLYAFALFVTVFASLVRQKPTDIEKIIRDAKSVFPNNSIEAYAFKVDWYNKLVAPKYNLDYKNDTIALIFFTIPYVFDNAFIPFLCQYKKKVVHHSWENFLGYYMKKVQQKLKKADDLTIPDEDIMYFYEMTSGHARILVQTAGHVAGAAYYYQRRDVVPDPWPKNKTIYGVSIHPLYGGYFSLDVVIILRDIQDPGIKPKLPPDVIKTWEKRTELLTIYNDDWKNPKWRELIPIKRKYTDEHMKYDLTFGGEREKYVEYLIHKHC